MGVPPVLLCATPSPPITPALTLRVDTHRVVLPAGEPDPGFGGVLEARQVLRGEAGLGALGPCGAGRINSGRSGPQARTAQARHRH